MIELSPTRFGVSSGRKSNRVSGMFDRETLVKMVLVQAAVIVVLVIVLFVNTLELLNSYQ